MARVVPIRRALGPEALAEAVADLARCGRIPLPSRAAALAVRSAAPFPVRVQRGRRMWWAEVWDRPRPHRRRVAPFLRDAALLVLLLAGAVGWTILLFLLVGGGPA